MLASGSNDKTISLLTVSTDSGTSELAFKAKKPFPYNKGTIRDILFTRDGLLVHGGGISPEIQVIDIKTFQSPMTLLGHTDQVLALNILPGGLLASGGQDKTVLMWDTRSQQSVSTLVADSAVASMTSSGNHLVTSHLDGSCAVYDLNTYKCVSTYSPHTQECRSVRYQPKTRHGLLDKGWVLSCSYDKTVCLTNTEDLQWTKLCQHEDKAIQCRWHPEGNIFASTGADKKACIWSLELPQSI
jgi:WD40 repeat protein